MIRKFAVCVGLVSALVFPAAASADTATIGSPLTNIYSGGVFTNKATTLQISFQPGTSPYPATSPANGVITSWSVKSGDAGANYALRVFRPTKAVDVTNEVENPFFGVGASAPTADVPPTVNPQGDVFTNPTTVAIKKGDYIGARQDGLADVGLPQFSANGRTTDMIANFLTGDAEVGGTGNYKNDFQHELLVQATVKFCKVPDLSKVKKADIPATLTKADCAAGKVKTKKLKKTKKNKKKLKTFPKLSLATGETAAPGTAVDVTVAKFKKKKK